MRQLHTRDFMAIILALLVAGGLAGWAASVAVNYFDRDNLNTGGSSSAQQQTVDPE
jgi:hypothetical protein